MRYRFAKLKSCGVRLYAQRMKGIFAFLVLMLAVASCRGPNGPVERAGRSVDDAVYEVGTGIKKTGEKIQEAAD